MPSAGETIKAFYDRGDGELFVKWLNRQAVCELNIGNEAEPAAWKPLTPFEAQLEGNPNRYRFRPLPAPPKKILRPWSWEQLWKEHRDDWFRLANKGPCVSEHLTYRATWANHGLHTIKLDDEVYDAARLAGEGWQYLAPSGEWLACGVWTEEQANA